MHQLCSDLSNSNSILMYPHNVSFRMKVLNLLCTYLMCIFLSVSILKTSYMYLDYEKQIPGVFFLFKYQSFKYFIKMFIHTLCLYTSSELASYVTMSFLKLQMRDVKLVQSNHRTTLIADLLRNVMIKFSWHGL